MAATSDFDEAQAAMRSVFLPLRMRLQERSPLSRLPLDLTVNAKRVGAVTTSYVRFGRAVHIDTVEAEQYHVNLPLSGGTDSRSGRLERVQATSERAAVFMPGLPADIDWYGDCAQLCLMFPRHILQTELEAMLDRPLAAPIEFAPAMDLTTDLGRAWRDALRLVEQQSRYRRGLLDHPLAAANLERLLVHGLLLAQPHNYTEALLEGSRRPAAPLAVRLAIDLMHSRPELPWSTPSLARRVTVSARSLQEGFRCSIGMPPMRYLRNVRLDRVHDDLLAVGPDEATVSQVAGRWGFLHLSRFAAAYRERFGQAPSQTLRHASAGRMLRAPPTARPP